MQDAKGYLFRFFENMDFLMKVGVNVNKMYIFCMKYFSVDPLQLFSIFLQIFCGTFYGS